MEFETFVGIAHELPNDLTVTLTVLHPRNKTVVRGSWNIETESFNPFEVMPGNISLREEPHTYTDAFIAPATFLRSHCGMSTRILVEFPPGEIRMTSVFSQFIALLIRSGLGACIIGSSNNATNVHFKAIPDESRPPFFKNDMVFLANGKARAYAMILWAGETYSPLHYSMAAALIAMNPHLLYYLKSRGEVFSSQDISLFLKNPEFLNPLVVSVDICYFLSKTSPQPEYDPEDLPLDFELGLKRFAFLPYGEALKFAVLSVCKLAGLRLHCLSTEDPRADTLLEEDPLGPDEYVAFDPSHLLPGWD